MGNGLKVAVVTRMTTQNAGNEALSAALIRFVTGQAAVAETRALDRYPRAFESQRLADDPKTAVDRFERTARALARRAAEVGQGALAPVAREADVKLDRTAHELPSGVKSLKRWLGVRRRLAGLELIEKDVLEQALRTLSWADLTIWNPAGEYHPTGDRNQPYRLLLMVRVAQLLGRRTAVVNQSLEIEDAALLAVVGHVYRACDFVCVRDAPSVKIARDLGVDDGKLAEAPDLVFLTPSSAEGPAGPYAGAIGLSVNGLQAGAGPDEWNALMARLDKTGRKLVFVSNAMNHDLEHARRLAAGRELEVVDRQPTHGELAELYRGVEVLISSRLHASILALSAGTPVVAIEPQVFKLTAIFEQMQYPLPCSSLRTAGWADRVASGVEAVLADRATFVRAGEEALERQRQRIRAAYAPLFALTPLAGAAAPIL